MKTRFSSAISLFLRFVLPLLFPLSGLAQEPHEIPSAPPDRMILCTDHCIQLNFKDGYDGYYIGVNGNGQPELKFRVSAWDTFYGLVGVDAISIEMDSTGKHTHWEFGTKPDPEGMRSGSMKGTYVKGHSLRAGICWGSAPCSKEQPFTLTWKAPDLNGRAAAAFNDDQPEVP